MIRKTPVVKMLCRIGMEIIKKNKLDNSSRLSGQSVIEVVAALAIFLIIVGSGVVTVLGALSTSRLGEEETQAASFAVEGIEAVTSIRNQSWDNLSSSLGSPKGLANSGGTWTFSGASDVDPSGKFTRVINLTSLKRDDNGNIADIGIVDPETIRVSSLVSWDFTAVRQNSINVVSYMTNWQEGGSPGGGSPTSTPTPSPTPSATPTPSSTPTPTLTPSPTPAITSCSSYCASIGYSTGTCRRRPPDCSTNAEVYESGGDLWCTVNPNNKCCCRP